MSEKLVRDGKVAVIVSPGFGAGWSTWNTSEAGSVFDPEIAQALLEGSPDKAVEIAQRKYPDAYTGGLSKAGIVWVSQGERFTIDEYDGSESLVILAPDYGYTA